MIKEIAKTYYKRWFRTNTSYSQTGEDVIASFYLNSIRKGFYIDVGTNDPIYLNNTYLFYKKGWRGICVEPNSKLCKSIWSVRRGDTILNVGVGQHTGHQDFFVFDPDTISTYSKQEAIEFQQLGHNLKTTIQLSILPLRDIIEKYANGKEIDLLSVDTEGLDMEVLLSNDWGKYRPKLVIVEVAEYRKNHLIRQNDQFDKFFTEQNYLKLADTYINALYIDKQFARLTKLI